MQTKFQFQKKKNWKVTFIEGGKERTAKKESGPQTLDCDGSKNISHW